LSPWAKVQINAIGPFPEDEYGNAYILVFIDCFSRFLLLYATKDVTAKAAHECILHMCGIFPTPEIYYTDNGSQFTAEMIEELYAMLGSVHDTSMVGSHEENGIVERANREVLRHLLAIVYDTKIKNKWSIALPIVNRILNAEINKTTGVAPYEIIFGSIAQIDKTLLQPFRKEEIFFKGTSVSEFTQKMLSLQAAAIEIARENISKKEQYHLRNAVDNEEGVMNFPKDSYVLATYGRKDDIMNRPPSKLHTRWRGPFQVINISKDGYEYEVKNLASGALLYFHYTQLKPFIYEKELTDPRLIALQDEDMYIVEAILNHQGEKNKSKIYKKTTLRFLTKWVGFDKPDWQPYKNLENNIILHNYLKKHKLEYLIPN
jgi:hypothetical protein